MNIIVTGQESHIAMYASQLNERKFVCNVMDIEDIRGFAATTESEAILVVTDDLSENVRQYLAPVGSKSYFINVMGSNAVNEDCQIALLAKMPCQFLFQASVKLVAAQIRNHVMARNGSSSSLLVMGNMEMDIHTSSVFIDGQAVSLAGNALRCLAKLMLNPGRIASYDALGRSCWSNYDELANPYNSVAIAIGRIRELLKNKQASYRIRTVRGVGYQLVEASFFHTA